MHECVHVFVSVCILCLCVCGGALALSSGVVEAVQEGVGSRGRTSGAAQAGILDGIVGEVRGGTEPRASVSPDLQLPSNPDLASGAEEGTAGGGGRRAQGTPSPKERYELRRVACRDREDIPETPKGPPLGSLPAAPGRGAAHLLLGLTALVPEPLAVIWGSGMTWVSLRLGPALAAPDHQMATWAKGNSEDGRAGASPAWSSSAICPLGRPRYSHMSSDTFSLLSFWTVCRTQGAVGVFGVSLLATEMAVSGQGAVGIGALGARETVLFPRPAPQGGPSGRDLRNQDAVGGSVLCALRNQDGAVCLGEKFPSGIGEKRAAHPFSVVREEGGIFHGLCGPQTQRNIYSWIRRGSLPPKLRKKEPALMWPLEVDIGTSRDELSLR